MNNDLTPTQANILRLAQTQNLASMTYRHIGTQIGGEHPYSVQLAIKSLIARGLLVENRRNKVISVPEKTFTGGDLINIPIMGKVSCGIATEIADHEPRGFITVSPSLIDMRHTRSMFALVACGNSMDMANINGHTVEEGDYVIVKKEGSETPRDGQYVISRYSDANNLKRLKIDRQHRRIILLSESTDPRPPIVIAEEEMEYYAIEGIAIDVVKAIPTLTTKK